MIRNRHRFFDTFLFLLQICEILRLAQQPDRFHVFRYPSLRRRVQRIRIEKKKKEKEKRGRVICCTPLQRCHGDIKPIWFTSVKFDSLAWKQQAIINFSGATKDMAFHYKLLAARNPRRTHRGVCGSARKSPDRPRPSNMNCDIPDERCYSLHRVIRVSPLFRISSKIESLENFSSRARLQPDIRTDILSLSLSVNTVDSVFSHTWMGLTDDNSGPARIRCQKIIII